MSKNWVRHAADLFCDTSIGLTPRAASTRQGRWVFVPDTESDRPKPKQRGQRLQFGASLSRCNDAPQETPQARARERPDYLSYDETGRVVRLQVGDVLFVDDRV